MKSFDVKMLVIGFLAGSLFAFTLGASRSSENNFGIAAAKDGKILVKTDRSAPYLVDAATGEAIPVTFGKDSRPKLY
ncbi:MAG: hypothetical protein KAS69_03650 [Planctomycetes bacterium]|nr:hypothetical protein [Planctomycetota bacterium]